MLWGISQIFMGMFYSAQYHPTWTHHPHLTPLNTDCLVFKNDANVEVFWTSEKPLQEICDWTRVSDEKRFLAENAKNYPLTWFSFCFFVSLQLLRITNACKRTQYSQSLISRRNAISPKFSNSWIKRDKCYAIWMTQIFNRTKEVCCYIKRYYQQILANSSSFKVSALGVEGAFFGFSVEFSEIR